MANNLNDLNFRLKRHMERINQILVNGGKSVDNKGAANMAKNDDTNNPLEDETNKALGEGYQIVEEIDDKTMAVGYDVFLGEKLLWSTATKPLAFAFIEGHKSDRGRGGVDKGKGAEKGGKPSEVAPATQTPGSSPERSVRGPGGGDGSKGGNKSASQSSPSNSGAAASPRKRMLI
jgi:hypothetical protein